MYIISNAVPWRVIFSHVPLKEVGVQAYIMCLRKLAIQSFLCPTNPLLSLFLEKRVVCLFVSFVKFCQFYQQVLRPSCLLNAFLSWCIGLLISIDHCSIEESSIFFICGSGAKLLDHSLILSHRHVSVCVRESCCRAIRALVVTLGRWQ